MYRQGEAHRFVNQLCMSDGKRVYIPHNDLEVSTELHRPTVHNNSIICQVSTRKIIFTGAQQRLSALLFEDRCPQLSRGHRFVVFLYNLKTRVLHHGRVAQISMYMEKQ